MLISRMLHGNALSCCKPPDVAAPCLAHLQTNNRTRNLISLQRPFRPAATPLSGLRQRSSLWELQPVSKSAVAMQGILSPEVINQPFLIANSTVCIPWLLMILAPKWDLTQKTFRSNWSILVPSIIFAFFFVGAALTDISSPIELVQKVKFLFIDAIQDPVKMQSMLSSGPGYAAQDWIHLIAWDLIGGRWIYLDGLDKKVPTQLSLVFTFTGGPLGFLVHWVTCTLNKKKLL